MRNGSLGKKAGRNRMAGSRLGWSGGRTAFTQKDQHLLMGQSPDGLEMEQDGEAAPVRAGMRERRSEVPGGMDPGEGTSYEQDPYEELPYSGRGAVAASGESTRVAGEYEASRKTISQATQWPWMGGALQAGATPNAYMTPGAPWPGSFWPPMGPQWFGWGMPMQPPSHNTPADEGKSAVIQQHPSVPNTGYNTVPMTAMPYSDYSTPLGDHLTAAVKEKIWRGDFLDFYELLNREFEVKEIDKDDEKLKEKHRRKRPDRNWTNWVTGFTIYAGVLVKMQPWKASALFQYFDIMRRAKAEFEGQAWLRYDEAFRMRSAIRPELRWDETHPGLWLQHMSPAKTNLGDRFDCGHLNLKYSSGAGARQGAGQAVQPRLPCFEFNNKGSCNKAQCRFRHECIGCGGRHPRSSCFKAGGLRQNKTGGAQRKPDGGGGTPGKGSHANQN
uniref:C3H1-type domain-containing protein n=1 Tax=Pogona vitticeps TaxID=103695 RepID=A0ABM5GAZ6_9SAUR